MIKQLATIVVCYLVVLGLVSIAAAAPSPAATQEWVRWYLASVNGTNNVQKVVAADGSYVIATAELKEYSALMVTNSANATMPNGKLFYAAESGLWKNGETAITATTTNLVFNGEGSAVVDGFDRFVGAGFSVLGTLITKSQMEALR